MKYKFNLFLQYQINDIFFKLFFLFCKFQINFNFFKIFLISKKLSQVLGKLLLMSFITTTFMHIIINIRNSRRRGLVLK